MEAADVLRIQDEEKNSVVTAHGLTLFWGGWASQWYPSMFILDGIEFNCAEQFMMWAKAKFFGDEATAKKVLEAKWPRTQKALGRAASPWNAQWDEPEGSRTVVLRGNMAKFHQNPALRELLMQTTGTIIAEASPYDGKWGIRLGMGHADAWRPDRWPGKNWLGQVLMQVRTLLGDERARG
jgi:ribA/ribD-fused uncharacterized protein